MRPTTAFALAVLALCPGCYPGIAWLPDSSGFVYTEGAQLRLFDVKTKDSRALVKDIGGEAWPAVSPDGRRVAVAHFSKAASLTVTVYDLKGQRLHRSRPLPWPDATLEYTERILPQVGWSPKGDRLLVYRLGRTIFYDPKTEKVTPVKGSLVTLGQREGALGGKAFLTLTGEGAYLVDWEGQARAIKMAAKLDMGNEKDGPLCETLLTTASRWQGEVAWLGPMPEGWLGVDTGKRVASLRRDGPGEEAVSHAFAKGVKVRVVAVGGMPVDGWRVEVVRPGQEPVELLPKIVDRPQLFPSPDGRWLAVGWVVASDGPGWRLALIDSAGKVVKRLGEPKPRP